MNPRSFLLYAALAATSASAQELSSTQVLEEEQDDQIAPSPCCGAAIVPGGHFEAEANYSGDGVRGNFVNTSNLTLKYSLTDHVQLQLATSNLFVGGGGVNARAFDGVSPGLKLVFLDEGSFAPQMAASLHAVFPTLSTADALQTSIDAYAMMYASKDVGPLHFDATASLALVNLTGSIVPQGGASFTATWNFAPHWGVASGPYSSFGNEALAPIDGGWFGALNFSPIPQLALSVGAEVGFFPQTRSFSFFGGVAWVPTANARVPLARATTQSTELIAVR